MKQIEVEIKKLEDELLNILTSRKLCEKLDFNFEAKILDLKYNLFVTFRNTLRDLEKESDEVIDCLKTALDVIDGDLTEFDRDWTNDVLKRNK